MLSVLQGPNHTLTHGRMGVKLMLSQPLLTPISLICSLNGTLQGTENPLKFYRRIQLTFNSLLLTGDGWFDRRDGVLRIATHSFTKLEVEQLTAILLEQFNLNSRIHIHRNKKGVEQYLIYIQNGKFLNCNLLLKHIYLLQWPIGLGSNSLGLLLNPSVLNSYQNPPGPVLNK